MEHLLLPAGACVARSDKAPYIADPYDGGPFLSYPERTRLKHIWHVYMPGGKKASNYSPRVDESHLADLEVFLQTWFFFGMLAEFFGNKALAEDFVETNTEDHSGLLQHGPRPQAVLTTVRLAPLVEAWIEEHRGMKTDDPLFDHLVLCVNTAWEICSMVYRAERTRISPAVLWCISSLIETLACVLENLVESRNLNKPWVRFLQTKEFSGGMRQRGWCPTDISKWYETAGNFQMLFYLSKMEQPPIKDHGNCAGDTCTAVQYDMGGAKAIHRCSDRQCGELHVDDERMMAILESGHTGLLDITMGDNLDSLRIEVVSSKDHSRYFALSHVWADGLGNPHANALPRCQLAYVAGIISALDSPTAHPTEKLLLWLDTICCPVISDLHRSMCLLRMPRIYLDAAHVLVLDAQLASYSSQEIDTVEVCARLMFSTWMRRLWTLQEGALNESVLVQLRDKAVSVDSIVEGMSGMNLMHYEMRATLLGKLKKFRSFLFPYHGEKREIRKADLHDLRSALDTRCVSVSTDEPLCLSVLMRLDQERLVVSAPQDRMAQFWMAMRNANHEIPRSILFFHGDRVKKEGLRWAPASLLDNVDLWSLRRPQEPDQTARMVPKGLLARFSAYEVVVPTALPPNDRARIDSIIDDTPSLNSLFFVRKTAQQWYMAMACLDRCHHTSPYIAIVEVMRRNAGRTTVLQDRPIDEMSNEFGGGDLSFGVSGSITGSAEEGSNGFSL